MTSSFIGCILTCTFLCICLNIGFLYVIFEQKRSCDRVVAELEFELEGYFQRRISNDFADSLHVPSHKQLVKNQRKNFTLKKRNLMKLWEILEFAKP